MNESADQVANIVQEDMEFTQLLSNPKYIEFLIAHKFFENQNFIYYLKYLDYIRNSSLVQLIKYPICLKMLSNIQDPNFINPWIENFKRRNEAPPLKHASKEKEEPKEAHPETPFSEFIDWQLFCHNLDIGNSKFKQDKID